MKKIKQILFATLFAIISLANIAGAQNIGGGIYAAGGSAAGCTTVVTNAVVFMGAATVAPCNSNLLFDPIAITLTVGSGSAASAGITLGNLASGYGGIWATVDGSPTTGNYILARGGSITSLNTASGGSIDFRINNTTTKITIPSTAGAGPSITTGTATTAVSPLSITQAFNNVATSFPGATIAYTGGATAAAGTNLLSVTLDAANMMVLSKAGNLGLVAGLVGAPTINFGTTNTGIWSVSSGNISVSAAGVENWRFMSNTTFYSAGGVALGQNVAVPFANINSPSANIIQIGTGTAWNASGTLQATTIALLSAGLVSWNADTGLSRCAAGTVCVGSGAAGSFGGILKLDTVQGGTILTLQGSTALTINNSSSGTLTFGSNAVTPASTGTRYLCISTTGVITSSAAVCAGT